MHLKEFSYQRQKCKHGLVPIKTHPRTEGAQTTLCFTSLPQYCCSQPPGNGFVSPHCVCSVYQKQIRLFLSPALCFSSLFSPFPEGMHACYSTKRAHRSNRHFCLSTGRWFSSSTGARCFPDLLQAVI